MVWLTIIGSASIQIRADDKYFEPDVQRAVKRIKNVAIQLKADVDITKASKKIRDLRYRITSKDAVLKVDANMAKAEEKMRKFLEKFVERKNLEFVATANTTGANTALTELRNRFVATRVPFTATANTAAARAALAYTSRRRVAHISAIIDPATMSALKGMFNTLTGTLPFEKVKAVLVGIAANFEGIAVKGTLVVSMLSALGGAALTAGANLFSVVGDMGQALGLVAAMPAGLFALVTMLKVNSMAWKNFGEASKESSAAANKALAKLPPQAQKAALAMREARVAISKPVQKAFWEAAGTSLQDMIKVQLPSLVAGMTRISKSMGGFSKEFFNTLAGLGDFNDVFANVSTSIDNMVGGINPATEGLAKFIGTGSKYLPQFGKWMTSLGKDFGDFATKAQETGKIDGWIKNGVEALKNIGSVAKDTVNIFNGLANASRLSGAASLEDMALGFDNIAKIVNGEPFQSRLVSILEGARGGTDKLGDGIRTLTDLFSESADSVGIFLDKAGEVAGLTFENITAMFAGTGLGSGLMDAMGGMSEAMEIMKPGFADLGSTIGDLGEIAGELFRSMAPGLNMLTETLKGVVAGLKDGVLAAMPVLNAFIQSMLGLASGPVVALAEGIGNILEGFAALPSGIQIVTAALVGFFLLKPKLDSMFNGMREGAARAFEGLATDAVAGGGRAQNGFGRSADAIRNAWRGVGTELSEGRALSGYFSNMDRLTAATGAAAGAIGTTAGQGLRMAGSGLMSALGGPWGAGLALAGAAIGLFAAEQAEAKAEVDGLAASLNQQTGAFTAASEKLMVTKVLDLNANAWDDFARSGRRNMEELAAATGLNMQDVTRELSNKEGRDTFVNNWKNVRDAMGDGSDVSDELAKSVGMTKQELEGLSQTDLDEMVRNFEGAARMAAEAEKKVQAVADAMGTNTIVAAELAKNYDTLKSSTSSASEKLSALKENLDLLSGGQKTARTVAREYAQSLEDQKIAMNELVTSNGGVIESTGRINDAFRGTLLNADKTFSTATQGARDFSVEMEKSADGILKQGTAALDAALKQGKSMPEAVASAMAAMDAPIATLRTTLGTLGFDAEQVNSILSQLGLDDAKLTAALSVDTAQAELDVARLKLSMTAYGDGNYTAVLAALPQAAKDAISETMGLGDEFAKGEYEAILQTLDLTAGGREAALAALLTYDGSDWTAFLKANNLVPKEVQAANDAAAKLVPEVSTKIKAEDLATGVMDGVKGYFIGDKATTLTANDLASHVLAAVNTSPLLDKEGKLTTQDLVTQMVDQVNAKALDNKLNTLETQDLVSAIMDQVNAKSLNGKANTLTTTDLATSVVNAVNSLVLRDKSFAITTRYLTSGSPVHGAGQVIANPFEQADGGIIKDGLQKFANGGILKGLQLPQVKAFANGGVENHTAQIAKGAWPVRIWAEPETGGEAYLPLSKNKRKRSLEILRQVMQEFGLGHLAQFADGGIMSTMKSSPTATSSFNGFKGSTGSVVTSTAYTPAGPTIVTNVYPSQGLDEEQVANSVSENIYWKLSTQF